MCFQLASADTRHDPLAVAPTAWQCAARESMSLGRGTTSGERTRAEFGEAPR